MKITIDGNEITTRDELHSFLAEKLSFPDTYGRNLDALFDCLTDIHTETEIEIINDKELAENLGNYAKALEKVLSQASKENAFITYIK